MKPLVAVVVGAGRGAVRAEGASAVVTTMEASRAESDVLARVNPVVSIETGPR